MGVASVWAFLNRKHRIHNYIRKIKGKKNNTHISISADVYNSVLEGDNFIGENTRLNNSTLGKFSYIGSDCFFLKTKIGRYCSIASGCRVVYGNHPTKKFVSTHPAFYSSKRSSGRSFVVDDKFQEMSYADEKKQFLVTIGNDVWIASHVMILNGVSIGDGSIIAAGAVVTQDVQPYAIVGGVPARIIGYRFDKDQIDKLEEIKWWDKDEHWIIDHLYAFEDIGIMMSVESEE